VFSARLMLSVCSDTRVNMKYSLWSKGREFLGAFTKLRKASIGTVMSVCPSVRIENNSAPTRRILTKFDFLFSRKSVETIQVSLQSDNNNRYFT
jgi:hypothetical protein